MYVCVYERHSHNIEKLRKVSFRILVLRINLSKKKNTHEIRLILDYRYQWIIGIIWNIGIYF